MKRRVGVKKRFREPRLVERGTEYFAEHGLGASHRLRIMYSCIMRTGCDGSARDSAGVSINSVLGKACIVRYWRTKVVPRS